MWQESEENLWKKRQSSSSDVRVMSNGFYDPSSPFASMRLLMASFFYFVYFILSFKIRNKKRSSLNKVRNKSTVCVEIETMMMSMNNTNCKYFERIFLLSVTVNVNHSFSDKKKTPISRRMYISHMALLLPLFHHP